MTTAPKLSPEDVHAIAVAVANELEARKKAPRSRPHPELHIRPTETDLAAVRKLASKMGLRPKRHG